MPESKRKILFVVNQKHYNIFNRKSAIDSILCSILLELSKNYEVSVNGKPMTSKLKFEQKAVDSLSSTSPLRKILPESLKQFFRDLSVFRTNKELFNEISQKQKPDVIIELMRYGSDLGQRLKDYFKVPLIAYFDAPSVEENKYLRGTYSPYYGRINLMEERTIEKADKVIVYSEAITDYWQTRIRPLNKSKFHVFQTLDYTRLNFNFEKSFNDPITIGFVGSFLKWHKVENLVNAFQKLREEDYDVRLLLIGAGEEFNSVSKVVEASKWKKDITLTGFIDGENLIKQRDRIDIGVMPGTHWYCMPTKVFEYGASGIASIAPGTNSIKCMFDKDELLFLEENSAEELYTTLKKFLNNKEQMKQMAFNLRAKIKSRNSLEQASKFYNQLISQILN